MKSSYFNSKENERKTCTKSKLKWTEVKTNAVRIENESKK